MSVCLNDVQFQACMQVCFSFASVMFSEHSKFKQTNYFFIVPAGLTTLLSSASGNWE